MNSGPRQLNPNRQLRDLKRTLKMAREALKPFAGNNPRDLTGSDLSVERCHVGIRMEKGQLMGPEECGRCSRELFARRTLIAINEALPGE